ncbi:MAG: YidC/Oxa1 family membrane protein insertase [Coriobacteriia bacterium]|nr:YidC/Oxa1 family membrane protein insertase [Coriobacteriia bacterium]
MGELWEAFKQIIFDLLQWIEGFTGDWGLAIIVLTVLVRLALMPLTIKQTKSMYELQRIQPKIKELQKKYADDKEKLQEETLKFYQDNKVNPFGGCLPMLLQMPLLFALYQVLGGTAGSPGIMMQYLENTGEVGKFFFLIPDIAKTPGMVFQAEGLVATLPYVILVALFGLSVWLPQALMPGEKQQKMIGAYMGVIMLFFGWTAPAGVLLYWDVSSIWGVAQQQIMMASMKKGEHEEQELAALAAAEAAAAKKDSAAKARSNKKKKS